MRELTESTIPIEVRGEVDARAVEQLVRCAEAGDAIKAAICADGHVGYSQPIGGVIAYRDYVSPSGVGYDIGCGNKAVRTNIDLSSILEWGGGREQTMTWLMGEIERRISFGMGRKNEEPVDHPVIDAIGEAAFIPQRGLRQLAADQLGTVGAGNHYVDIFVDDDNQLWIGVHFGSRGFGHKTASGFLALAQEKRFDERASEGEMDAPPTLLDIRTDLGQSYIEAMTLAGDYAYAGRDVVVAKVLEILGANVVDEVHNHHNYAWEEVVSGERCWVIRKGATPAYPGQRGFVGGTMGEDSVILRGRDDAASADGALSLLYSTVHGAGRLMSRTQAAGKQGTVAECSDRDCSYSKTWKQYKTETTGLRPDQISFCPDHPRNRVLKLRKRIREGAISWPDVLADLAEKQIVLRGGAADEAPGAYKRLSAVLAAHEDTVEVEYRLHPLGVAMAASDTHDPYKD